MHYVVLTPLACFKICFANVLLDPFIPRTSQAVQQQLSKKEIEDLLRRGAYGAIMDEEDEGAKFCEEDIDQILQRRTKTITIESEGRGSTFAKVSDTSDTGQLADLKFQPGAVGDECLMWLWCLLSG